MADKQPRDGEGNFTERVKKSPKHLSEVVVVCLFCQLDTAKVIQEEEP